MMAPLVVAFATENTKNSPTPSEIAMQQTDNTEPPELPTFKSPPPPTKKSRNSTTPLISSVKSFARNILARITPGKKAKKMQRGMFLKCDNTTVTTKVTSVRSAPKRNLFGLDTSAPSQVPDPDGSDFDKLVNLPDSDGSDIHTDEATASGIDGRAGANNETRSNSYQGPPDSIEDILDKYDSDEDARLAMEKRQANEQRQEASKQQKFKDADAVLDCIAHLAATGSQQFRDTFMSILAGNMTCANANKYLLERGYGQKWMEQVIHNKKKRNEDNKKKRNEAHTTRATTGTEPQLEEEVAMKKFTGRFKGSTAAARAKHNLMSTY
jgi:hypothetical protein